MPNVASYLNLIKSNIIIIEVLFKLVIEQIILKKNGKL